MDYFYALPEDIQGDSIVLTGDESKHLARVLRTKVGEHVFVTDGLDMMYEAEVMGLGKVSTACRIVRRLERFNEPSVEVTLAVSLLRNPARFDFLVEKVTEIGVRRIVPLLCERTIPKRDKHDRLQKLALAAMKQCGRSFLPPVDPAIPFDRFVHDADAAALRFLPHEQTASSETITEAMRRHPALKKIVFAIGPEGGFTDEETALALQAGFVTVSLGERRLRTETAAIAAAARMLS